MAGQYVRNDFLLLFAATLITPLQAVVLKVCQVDGWLPGGACNDNAYYDTPRYISLAVYECVWVCVCVALPRTI